MDIITYLRCRKLIKKYVKDLAGGMKYMGSVPTAADLPTPKESIKGHAYTTSDNGHEHVCDGTQWVDLSADLDNKQDKLTAGANITIENNVISASCTSNTEYIELTGWNEAAGWHDGGTLTDAQAAILVKNELNYIWMNGMHRLDFRYKDDAYNLATYSANDGTKCHVIEITLSTKTWRYTHTQLQDKLTAGTNVQISGTTISATDTIYNDTEVRGLISAETTARVDADTTLQNNINTKQDKLTAGTGIKLEDNTISADVRTYKSFPSSWPHEAGTTIATFCAAVNASYKSGEIKVGDAFLGNVNSTAFFNGAYVEGGGSLGSAEVSVQIMTPFGQNCVQLLTTTSSNNAPYHWEYTYVDGAASEGWRCWSQYSYVNNKLSSKQDKLTAGDNITISNNKISATDTVYDDTQVRSLISTNTTALGGLKFVALTQAQYDALTVKDASTLYIIKNA